jgi:apolipoprotein N-acyltransferase
MRKSIAVAALLLTAGNAHAANLAVITSAPTLLHTVVLACAVVCAVGSFKVLDAVRGGMLGRTWLMFFIGFVVLGLSQLTWLIEALQIGGMPSFVAPLLLIAAVGLFAYGIRETRRSLS